MRLILKILFAPVIAALAILIGFAGFVLQLSAVLFGIAGTILGILGLAILILGSVKNGIIVLVIAFLVSPLGLPMLAAWLLGQLQGLRYWIQARIY